MIKRIFYSQREDGVKLYKTYSDLGLYVKKAGTEEIYDAAIDIEGSNNEYFETDKKIEEGDEND